MSTNAFLPCFVCGATLPNAFVDADNQPAGGTEFRTHGHYGSSFWDDFDGDALVLNICDPCLCARTDRLGQQKSYLPVRCNGFQVGRQDVDRPMVAYTGNADDSSVSVDPEELGTDIDGVAWFPGSAELREHRLREAGT
jgi:hypothetical protein